MTTTRKNLPAGGQLVTKAGVWSAAMWAWMRDLTVQAAGGAPSDASYLVGAAHSELSAERVVTNTATAAWDLTTPGQAKVNVPDDAITFAKLQEIATQRVIGRNTAGTGNPEEVTASQLLDWLGSTRGSVLYRGAAGWAILAPGTLAFVLTSNGAGADPSYQAIPEANIQTLLDGISTTHGVILYYNGTDWVALAPGTAGQVLETQGTSANPQWVDVSGGGHLHGLMRVLGDGATTVFNLLDIAEYLEHIANAGAVVDPLDVTLSADGSQVTFAAAPTAGNVLALEYVIAGV